MEPAENQASPLHPHEPEIAQSIDEEGRCRVCHIMAERDELAKNLGIWASEALIRQAEVRDLKAEREEARELLRELVAADDEDCNVCGGTEDGCLPDCATGPARTFLEGSK